MIQSTTEVLPHPRFWCIITTVQEPTKAAGALAERLQCSGGAVLIVGDKKGPTTYDLPGAQFLSLARQLEGAFGLAKALPMGHYSRKNVGYLQAMAQGAICIYETDDDNAPLPGWRPRLLEICTEQIEDLGWVNVYRCYTKERIWPRGFPLDAVAGSMESAPRMGGGMVTVQAPIQQGLANNSPDVDAVWRLALDAAFDFEAGPSVRLRPGAWCPFNSQSTWWWPEAYPLMYLPSYSSFRMTDIWRSFVAQRCLWELGRGLVFHGADVVQERNPHNLMRDFEDEVSGYLHNRELVRTLEGLTLRSGEENAGANLYTCYEALVAGGLFPQGELALVEAWLGDLEKVKR